MNQENASSILAPGTTPAQEPALSKPIVTKDFTSLPQDTYGAILADPPWTFRTRSVRGITAKGAGGQYSTMSLEDIQALPVRQLLSRDGYCFLWATAPMLDQGLATLKAWGFDYVTAAAWAKSSSTGRKWAFGTGYVFRSAAEFLLVGKKGAPRPQSRSVRNLLDDPIREHSRKPDSIYPLVEKVSLGPYCELWARQAWPQWSAWGNEVQKFPIARPPLTATERTLDCLPYLNSGPSTVHVAPLQGPPDNRSKVIH